MHWRGEVLELTALDFLLLMAKMSSKSSTGLFASSSDEYSRPSISCSMIRPFSFARFATPLRTLTRDGPVEGFSSMSIDP
jgi:hypothetical protein